MSGHGQHMITPVIQVAVGGATGAVLRYVVGLAIVRHLGPTGLPLAVLTVNVAGSILMGVIAAWLAARGLTSYAPLLMTGILGGFTTFSAFSLETVTLIERGDHGLALLYVGLSVGLCCAGLAIGLLATRGILGT